MNTMPTVRINQGEFNLITNINDALCKIKFTQISYAYDNRTHTESIRHHLIGKCGEYVCYKYLNRLDDFFTYNNLQIASGKVGDGGIDIPGFAGRKVDVKTAGHYYKTIYIPYPEFHEDSYIVRVYFENDKANIAHIAGYCLAKDFTPGTGSKYSNPCMKFSMKNLKPIQELFSI